MKWQTPLMIILTLGTAKSASAGMRDSDNYLTEGEFFEEDLKPSENDDDHVDDVIRFLARMLVLPWPDGTLPLLYVEKPEQTLEENENEQMSDKSDLLTQRTSPEKRARYYRKYPWKRQNGRYDPTNPYICTPSKDEVYRLLVALQDARQGQNERVVNFCNRKRPAFTVYTNIRFLGK